MFLSFFLAKKPTYRLKSSKFYFSYLKTRSRFLKLGLKAGNRSKKASGFARYLVLKKFFKFFYGFKKNLKFRHFFQHQKRRLASRSISFRYGKFTRLLYNLERQLPIVLFRMRFVSSLTLARCLIHIGLIFVNGQEIRKPSYIVPVNAIIEVLSIFLYTYFFCLVYYHPFFFSPTFLFLLLPTLTSRWIRYSGLKKRNRNLWLLFKKSISLKRRRVIVETIF